MCTFCQRQTKMDSQIGTAHEVENMAAFPILKTSSIFLWTFELSRIFFYVFISVIILKKIKAYLGLPIRLERILSHNFSFYICIWLYDKAGTKTFCINCPELMRKEQRLCKLCLHPKGRLNDALVLCVEESFTAHLHIEESNGRTSHHEVHVGIACQTQKILCHSGQYHIYVVGDNLLTGQQHHSSHQINVVKFNVFFFVVFFVFIL